MIWLSLLTLLTTSAAAGDLPNHRLTPGAINHVLTQELICSKNFRTGPYRHVTPAAKRKAYAIYYASPKRKPCPCELDHLVSLELGGSNSVRNLWPEPYAGRWNARVKDKVENRLHREVCAGRITLGTAQHMIAGDWRISYRRYFGNPQ
jgi:hypothetical protein